MIRLFIVTALLLLPNTLHAWGRYAHRVIAEIAERNLTREAKKEIELLLGKDVSLKEISNWADDVKVQKRVRSKWHYIFMPKRATAFDPVRHCPKSGCLVPAIQIFMDFLSDARNDLDDREEALKYLVHLVGDLHQPLHCGYREDKGGRAVQVKFMGKKTNLHDVWDSGILGYDQMEFKEYISKLLRRVDKNWPEKYLKGSLLDWVFESRSLLPKYVYTFDRDKSLARHYHSRVLPVVDTQVLKAGLRLAGLLNSIFEDYYRDREGGRWR